MHPQVDMYLKTAKRWRKELWKLRAIVLKAGLTEEWKWRAPCYTHQGSNVVILGDFKEFCTVSFFKGGLLKDPHNVLVKPGENTRAARMIRLTSVEEIEELEPIIIAYLHEAIAVEEAGLQVDFSKGREVEIPAELQTKFDEHPKFETAFDALTPGRQRAYLLHFSSAKQSQTRTTRIEKYIPRILNGKGINDCVCGHSKRMPACDGSHKSVR